MNKKKDNQVTSEETHGTEDVYCCACEYDIACFESKLRELLQAQKEELKKKIEGLNEGLCDGVDCESCYGQKLMSQKILNLLK